MDDRAEDYLRMASTDIQDLVLAGFELLELRHRFCVDPTPSHTLTVTRLPPEALQSAQPPLRETGSVISRLPW